MIFQMSMMVDERVRYFKDEYDSSQEKHNFTLEGGSFLFGSDKEEEAKVSTPERISISTPLHSGCASASVSSDDQLQDAVRYNSSKSVIEYMSQMKQIIPDMNLNVAKRLIKKHSGEEDVISRAIDEYFEETLTDKVPIVANGTVVNDANSSFVRDSKKRSQKFPISETKRFKDITQKASKEIRDETEWKRFIGSLQVNAMATRPTLRPLRYGSALEILKSSSSLRPSSIYDSNGRKKVSVSSFAKIFDVQQSREIGRLPEDIAQVVYPLIDMEGVVFEATMVFCENKRLSVGDSFVLQLDCFLTSSIFGELGNEEHASSQSSRWMSSISMAETEEELQSRSRNAGLWSLFEKLRLKTVDGVRTDDSSTIVNSDDDSVEIIDLNEDEDKIQSTPCENMACEMNDRSFSSQREDILNLNQLKVLYRASQSSIDSLKDMPQTEPSCKAIGLRLRKYQKQGLTWMLRREHEFEKAASSDGFMKLDGNLMNPLWKCFKWPKDMSWAAQRKKNHANVSVSKLFYANLHTGEFRLEKPVLRTMIKGGILSDEMGLGKTILALSLIVTSPYDASVVDKHLFMNNEQGSPSFPSSQLAERPYAAKTTLIVVPTSLLSQWHSEFMKLNRSPDLYCELYYGGNVSSLKALLTRSKNPPAVVLTTYGIVQNEWTKMVNINRKDAIVDSNPGLFSLQFYRVILDEGHVIRNRTTSTSKATMEISGKCRWVLTGTPIINRLDDLYSIVKFLKLEPWAQINYWKMFVSSPFERKDYKQAFDVVNAILDPVLLRRTKQMRDTSGRPLVELPSKEIIVEKLKFNKIQNDVYRQYLEEAETSVKKCLAGGDLLKKYPMILVYILRLRQICCDVRLLGEHDENDEDLAKSARAFNDSINMKRVCEKIAFNLDSDRLDAIKSVILDKYPTENSLKNLECSICTVDPIEPHKILFTECCHCFCENCLKDYLEFQKQKGIELKCPNCRRLINMNYLFTLNFKEGMSNVVPLCKAKSSKIEALLTHCDILQATSPGEHIVVFSQFSSFLDILESEISSAFHGKKVSVYKFNGRLNLKERASVLEGFSKRDLGKQKILLISLRTGGVGLNLTCASHVFIMDPWWSPSMEDQAIDRIHRIGQVNQVKVVRFIIESSIEEKMLKIQERKRTIGEVMDADEEGRRKRRIDEIRMLFE